MEEQGKGINNSFQTDAARVSKPRSLNNSIRPRTTTRAANDPLLPSCLDKPRPQHGRTIWTLSRMMLMEDLDGPVPRIMARELEKTFAKRNLMSADRRGDLRMSAKTRNRIAHGHPLEDNLSHDDLLSFLTTARNVLGDLIRTVDARQ